MAFVSSFVVGFVVGMGFVMAFVHSENRRAQARQRQVTWLNRKLKNIWPFVDKASSELIKTVVEPILEQYRPSIVSSLKLKKFTMGTIAPQLVGVQVVDRKDDAVVMEVQVQWDGNPSIILAAETKIGVILPIQVKDVGFAGVFRLAFKPLVEELPCFGALTYSLLVKKKLDFQLKVIGADATSVPGIAGILEGMIKTAITDSLLWPMRQVLPILPGDYSNLALKPIGVLEVKLVQAKDLLNKDAIGKSDPFVLLYIRPMPSRMKKTRTIDNQLNPIWNEHFQFEVEDLETQKLTIRICDEEGFLSAQLLGYAEVPLKDMEAGLLKELWLPLVKDPEKTTEAKNRGEVHLELLYSPFDQRQKVPLSTSLFDSITNVDVANSPATEHMAISNGKNHHISEDKPSTTGNKGVSKHIIYKQDHFVRGVLSVTVLRAENLIVADYKGKADPYAVLTLKKSDQKKKTKVVYQELNPQWNQTLDFLVEDAMHEMLVLEIWDHDTFKKDYMGRCALSLTKALLEGEYDTEYQLDGVKSGKVFLHIKWLPQPIPFEGQNSAI
ncbi:hypothetical protein O6H91_12G029200 [Diphasiastrum complanatum]|uniref:Uncharacterized protein n=1 Tax=Diphasiastrum complanatum TaxID=34168 RepID=A0ACC2C083_DIPCM|nr:hypothetical protein O6H91_12G029200 [Diphasiastrum complanatum]